MARFTPGAIVSEVSGKIAATVYEARGSAPRIVTRKASHKKAARGITRTQQRTAHLTHTWRTLTEAQRQAWEYAASSEFSHDSLGQQIKMNGYQMFVQRNFWRLVAGESVLLMPVQSPSFPLQQIDWRQASASGNKLFRITSTMSSDFRSLAFASYQQSQGVAQPHPGKFIYLRIGNHTVSTLINFTSSFNANMPPITPGLRQWYMCKLLHLPSGKVSKPFFNSLDITP